MKKIIYIIIFCLVAGLLGACHKEPVKTYGNASLNVVNASQSVPGMAVFFNGIKSYFSVWVGPNYNGPITYGGFDEFGQPAGNSTVELVSSLDTTHSFYKKTLNFSAGSIHSLYIIGRDAPETLLLEDHIPSYQDSTSGVRFINLSPDSKPVTINLQGNDATNTEFSSLAYKQISAFKGYSAKLPFLYNGYTFEVRDAASGDLLTTFTWTLKPFFCNTLVIGGLEGDGSINVFPVNHY